MFLTLLQNEVQDFINANLDKPLSKLALQKNPFPEVEWISVLNQIEAKVKAKDKLPTWFNTKNIVYPTKLSIEQTSSERTAKYKAELLSGTSLIDLTGGFGVDDFYFAKRFKTLTHCELNEDLSNIVKHNFSQLDITNCVFYTGDSTTILTQLDQKWDWIYIDPSRRNESKGKVFMLKDCLPNVPENLEHYFKHTDSILMKTAPLLDLKAGIAELTNIKAIHIIALENEVKELLWEIHSNYQGDICIKTVNLTKEKEDIFQFLMNDIPSFSNYQLPTRFLYEPNSAIMKSGCFELIPLRFDVFKMNKNSHLYTSDEILNFPGRTFEILNLIPYQKTFLKEHLQSKQANITTRNFPDSVETIRKKWKIKDGGNVYCFFTTDVNNDKIVLICRKL